MSNANSTPTAHEYWIVGSPTGEYVMYYNHTGHVMHFTTDRAEARRFTDAGDAYEVQRIARDLYRRDSLFKAVFVCE